MTTSSLQQPTRRRAYIALPGAPGLIGAGLVRLPGGRAAGGDGSTSASTAMSATCEYGRSDGHLRLARERRAGNTRACAGPQGPCRTRHHQRIRPAPVPGQ